MQIYLIDQLYMNVINFLEGKKTYIMAVLLAMYAIGGYFTGHLTLEAALGLFWASGTVSAIRSAIAKGQ